MDKWKLLKSKMALDEKWFKVRCDEVELPSGKILPDFFVWESGNVSMTVPVTDEGKLILVRQYKHGIGQIMIEFPAGYLNKGETVEQAARRELSEETGREVIKLISLGKVVHSPTKETGVLSLFLAKVGETEIVMDHDDNEEIETLELTPQDVLDKIRSGEIWATGTIAAFFLAQDKSDNFKI